MQRAEEIAHLAPESPEYMPPLGPQTYLSPPSSATTPLTPAGRAQAAADSMALCAAKNLAAAGFLDGGTRFTALRNSKGLEAYQQSTNTDFFGDGAHARRPGLGLRHCRRYGRG